MELLAYLEQVRYPLAVRSSSLLEDSQYQPFTGVYQTFMLPNQDEDVAVRLEQLMDAIKRVYASTFSQHAKAYIRATPYRLEEEKMAVILQRVVGSSAWGAVLSGFFGSGAVVEFLSDCACRLPRMGLPPWRWDWAARWWMAASA